MKHYHPLIQCETNFAGTNLCDAGACKGHNDSHYINGELKLEELRDAVIDVPSPHDGFDDAGKVVISQDDVRCLFGNVCASNTLETEAKTDS